MIMCRTAPYTALLAVLALCLLSGCSDSPPEADEQGAPATSPPPATAGDAPGAPGSDMDDAQMTLISEYQQIQRRLGDIQRRAMQDSSLMAAYADLESRIEEEMQNVDPGIGDKRDKLAALQQDLTSAQQTGDQDAMRRIREEGMALQSELETLQRQVIDGEALTEDVQNFRDSIEAKMQEIDPETEQLMARANEIVDSLQEEQESESQEEDNDDGEEAPAAPGQ